MTRILWFHSDFTGCGTYRALLPAFHLADTKQAVCEATLQRDVVTKGMRDDDYAAADVMVFQRAVGGPWPEIMRECARKGVKTVFELDDDLFDIPRNNPSRDFWHRRDMQRDLRAQLKAADRVIVSTKPLVARVAREADVDPTAITVCPNYMERVVWHPDALKDIQPYDNGDTVVIGWQGSQTHNSDFMMVADALVTVLNRYPQAKLRLFGGVPDIIRKLVPEARRDVIKGVPFQQYPGTLKFANFDIGIAPLTPCLFNQGKSNLKWLEYSALGIPCVASDVYPYGRSIRSGVDGLLATTPAQWVDHLSTLIENPTLRRLIGDAASARIWTECSETQAGPSWARVFAALHTPDPVCQPTSTST